MEKPKEMREVSLRAQSVELAVELCVKPLVLLYYSLAKATAPFPR